MARYIRIPKTSLLILGCWTSYLSLATYGAQDMILNIPEGLLRNFVNVSFSEHYGYYLDEFDLDMLWGSIVAALACGAVFGAMAAVPLADYYGRKLVLLGISNVCVLIGSLCMVFARYSEAFELLLLGRLILGVSVGLATTVLPMYLIELSPISVRGFMASLHGVANNIAGFIAILLSLPSLLGTEHLWGYLLASQIVWAVLQLASMPFCPESPQYLYIRCGETAKALEIAQEYSYDEGESTEDVLQRWEQEKQLQSGREPLRRLMKSVRFRKAFLLAVIVGISRSATGVTVFDSYSTAIFRGSGMTKEISMYASLAYQIPPAFLGVVNTLFVDKLGRRFFYLGGLGIMAVGWFLAFIFDAISYYDPWNYFWTKWIVLGILELIMTFVYPVGPANLTWFLAAELVPANLRSFISGVSLTSLWSSYLLMTLIFPAFSQVAGPWASLLLFALPLFAIVIYMHNHLPETGSRSIPEIYNELSVKSAGPTDPHAELLAEPAVNYNT